jgi:hypothetical protein
MCTLWSDNTCVFTRFYSVKNANTQLIWSSAQAVEKKFVRKPISTPTSAEILTKLDTISTPEGSIFNKFRQLSSSDRVKQVWSLVNRARHLVTLDRPLIRLARPLKTVGLKWQVSQKDRFCRDKHLDLKIY